MLYFKEKSAKIICSLQLIALFFLPGLLFSQQIYSTNLWQKGTGLYNGYRIPSLIVTKKGTLLAFCEGREGGDAGDIDILLKRSTDNGLTWSAETVVWNDKDNTCGNPCPVVDQESGRIWLFLTWNLGADHEGKVILKESTDTRRPFLCYSDDDGITWSKPKDVSKTCKDPSWGWYATGPGVAIQLKSDKYNGRFVIPANHSYDDPDGNLRDGPYSFGSHVLLSDDSGVTWRKSQPIRPGCNESQVVELSDGSLLMNMRSYNDKYCRSISKSTDGGETWSEIWHDSQLVESKCQASLLYYGPYKGKNMILFSNPAVPKGRTHMTIKVSFDEAKSWTNAKLIYPGPAAYSCLTVLPDGKIGIFYECGEFNAYETIRFSAFPAGMLFNPGSFVEK